MSQKHHFWGHLLYMSKTSWQRDFPLQTQRDQADADTSPGK